MDIDPPQRPAPTHSSTEDYWAQVQRLRAELAALRPARQPV